MEVLGLTDFWKDRRVLLTGHTGFKGAWLTLWLRQQGANVQGLALEPEQPPGLLDRFNLTSEIRHEIQDIRDADAVRKLVLEFAPEIVLHLAAQPLVRRSYREPVVTWNTNVLGTINLMEAVKDLDEPVVVLVVTTDKVYQDRGCEYFHHEDDALGGRDPYSSSKVATETAVESWRKSFFDDGTGVAIATARAGNVIGGGDYSEDRIVPDIIRSLQNNQVITVRNPLATRPWQHVLEPLSGYLKFAETIHRAQANRDITSLRQLCSAVNFGPRSESSRTVRDLVEATLSHWPGTWKDESSDDDPHEATFLGLAVDKSNQLLNWAPRWSFEQSVEMTIEWYQKVFAGDDPRALALEQIRRYECE